MNESPDVVLNSVVIDSDRIAITYMLDPGGLRADGAILQTHSMVILRTPDYETAIDKIETKVKALVRDALEDWESSTPVLVSEVDSSNSEEDEDDLGLGWE